VDECRLIAWLLDRLEEAIDDHRIRGRCVERDVHVGETGGLRRVLCFCDVHAGFARLPQVDDRRKAHLLYCGHCFDVRRTCAGDGRLETVEVADARDFFFGDSDLLGGRDRDGDDACREGERTREDVTAHGNGSCGEAGYAGLRRIPQQTACNAK
jgi:hypothetical protein